MLFKIIVLRLRNLPPIPPTAAVRLCVYTMKKELMKEGLICLDSMKFTSGRLTTAKQVLNRVLTHLKIPQTDWKVYGLWLKSENLRECLSTCNVYWLAFTDFLYQCWPNQSIHCHVTDNKSIMIHLGILCVGNSIRAFQYV